MRSTGRVGWRVSRPGGFGRGFLDEWLKWQGLGYYSRPRLHEVAQLLVGGPWPRTEQDGAAGTAAPLQAASSPVPSIFGCPSWMARQTVLRADGPSARQRRRPFGLEQALLDPLRPWNNQALMDLGPRLHSPAGLLLLPLESHCCLRCRRSLPLARDRCFQALALPGDRCGRRAQ